MSKDLCVKEERCAPYPKPLESVKSNSSGSAGSQLTPISAHDRLAQKPRNLRYPALLNLTIVCGAQEGLEFRASYNGSKLNHPKAIAGVKLTAKPTKLARVRLETHRRC